MEQFPSPRQSSPRQVSPRTNLDVIKTTRSRVPSDPIIRVKEQSKNDIFSKEENIGQKSESAFVRQRSESDKK
jgi:hypothetical protein